jgi:hypothetical protein
VAKVTDAFVTTRKRLKSLNCVVAYFKADDGEAEELQTERIMNTFCMDDILFILYTGSTSRILS